MSVLLKKCIYMMELFRKNGSASRADITEHLLKYFPGDGPLPRSTFNRYKDFIEEHFSCSLEYDKKAKKYFLRQLKSADPFYDSIANYLLAMYKTLDAAPMLLKHRDKIFNPEIITGVENIAVVLEAFDKKRGLHCTYHSFNGGTTKTRTIIPYFLSTWEGRWYLIAEPTTHSGSQVVYALERMSDISLTNEDMLPSEKFSMEEYFKDSYGIQHANTDDRPMDIILRATGSEVEYLRARPIHSSQKELLYYNGYPLVETEGAIFSLHLVPCYNFYQQLLWHREAIEILEPAELRDVISNIAEKIKDKYRME